MMMMMMMVMVMMMAAVILVICIVAFIVSNITRTHTYKGSMKMREFEVMIPACPETSSSKVGRKLLQNDKILQDA